MAVNTLAVSRSLFVDQFVRSLRAENLSERTVTKYRESVALLAGFLHRAGMPNRPEAINREHIEAFVEAQLQKHKPATAATRYRALQRYFRWLREEGEIQRNPMVNMRPPRVPENPPPILSDASIQKLLKVCSGGGFQDRRDIAIIRMLLDTGLRRSELAYLTLEHMDLDQQYVMVSGKGSRGRAVPYGRKAARDL
ncbi:MAG: tyrosine-type recombinase/integrase, partial [Chloroflexi bacterium]|nr:tyrosine-type recombinase/integrase [Chloroflexota bacterium]